MGIYKKDEKIRSVFSGPISKAIWLIILITIFQILITKMRYPSENFGSIFRIGRQYFYYAIYFPAVYVLMDKIRFKRFLKWLLTIVVAFCLLFILQTIIGSIPKLFPFGRVEYQSLQGFKVVRIYLGGITVPALIFQVLLMILLFGNFQKKRIQILFLTVITGMQALLTFYRAHIIGIFVGTMAGFIVAKGMPRMKRLFQLVAAICCFFILADMGFKVLYPNKTSLIQAFGARISSVHTAVLTKGDTFGYRLEQSQGMYEIIRQNPFFGGGFVHDESNLFARQRINGLISAGIRAGESGFLTLLFDLGLMGLIWLGYLSYCFIKRFLFIYRFSKDSMLKAVALGILSFYCGRILASIIQPAYVGYQSILVLVLALVFLELCALEIKRQLT